MSMGGNIGTSRVIAICSLQINMNHETRVAVICATSNQRTRLRRLNYIHKDAATQF